MRPSLSPSTVMPNAPTASPAMYLLDNNELVSCCIQLMTRRLPQKIRSCARSSKFNILREKTYTATTAPVKPSDGEPIYSTQESCAIVVVAMPLEYISCEPCRRLNCALLRVKPKEECPYRREHGDGQSVPICCHLDKFELWTRSNNIVRALSNEREGELG